MRRRRRRSEYWSAIRRRSRQADRQVAGDLGDVSVLRIDLDNPFGADLGDDKHSIRPERDALGHLQVLGDDGPLAVDSTFDT